MIGLGDYFDFPHVPALLYPVHYDPLLVTLSVGIAIFAAYAALDVSEQVAATPPGARRMRWLAMGGVALGGGVWAMHFLGMLALSLPCDVHYDLFVTSVSMLPGIIASIFALNVISRRQISTAQLIEASILIGTGIGAMHYTGMAALRMYALLRYDPALFLVSLVVAIVLACLALTVKFRFARGAITSPLHIKLASAILMGIAVSGMHYTAMAAAHFIPYGDPALQPSEGFHKELLIEPVLVLNALLIAAATAASSARRLRDAAERYRMVADYTYAWETWLDENGHYRYVSPSALSITGYPAQAFVDDPELLNRIVHPEDLERYACHFREPSDKIHHLIFRIHHKDGHLVWLEHYCRPVYGDDGRYLGRRGSNNNITVRKQAEDRLRKLSLAVEQNPCSIVVADRNGILEYVNERFVLETGYSREEAIGHNPKILQSGLTERNIYAELWGRLTRGESWQGEFINKRKDGSIYIERAFIAPLVGEKNRITNYVGIKLNITDQKQTEEYLRLAASVFENALEGIVITDCQCQIVDVNSTYCDITGYSREELLGQNPKILKSGLQDKEFYAALWADIKSHGYWRGELWNRRKDGQVYAQKLTISTVHDDHGKVTHYVGIISDITQFKENELRLEHIAHYDALTHLPNRMLLADRMRQAMALASRNRQMLAVCYLDLDGFKPINDQYGHDAGDRLLVEIAGRLVEMLRETDTVARLGGDEFALLLCGFENTGDCENTIDRLLKAIAQPYHLPNGPELAVTGSIGYTLYPQDEVDADTLLRHADQAMYRAKQIGRNRHHAFDLAEHQQASAQWIVRARLEEALRKGEFLLHYQPKVNMRHGTVVGFEALLRWQNPERGLMLPGDFLPMIEESELAVEVGLWVIRRALRQLSLWNHEGVEFSVSVNVFAIQLQRHDFTQQVRQLLNEFPDVAPQQLEFEVLENSALADMDHISQVIVDCQSMGVSFALDDFGTGYASLNYLRRLPAKILKIDQSFVHDMLNDKDDLAIVEGVIALAKTFNRVVVAEGVQSIEQGLKLLRLGCDIAQGYGIAKPMPDGEVLGWQAGYQPSPAWRQPEQAI